MNAVQLKLLYSMLPSIQDNVAQRHAAASFSHHILQLT
jgi:hypothetical protein